MIRLITMSSQPNCFEVVLFYRCLVDDAVFVVVVVLDVDFVV